MNFRQFFQDYFTFSRNERRGITILLVLIFILGIANKVIFYFETPGKIDHALFDSARYELGLLNDSVSHEITTKELFFFNPNTIDSTVLFRLDIPELVKQNLLKYRLKGGKFYAKSDFRKIYGVNEQLYQRIEPFLMFENDKAEKTVPIIHEIFVFDPNTASDLDFNRLGLSVKQIQTIRNYQSKGGSFKDKDDFFKIWGLTEEQKRDLADYIQVKGKEDQVISTAKPKEFPGVILDINSADSVDFELLPGVGDKLSKRIVRYRESLGGFYSHEQLKEVYGLTPETVLQISKMITVDYSKIRKIDFNFSDMAELSRHPYLRNQLSKQIIRFRTKYGKITSLEVLRDSMILNIDEYNRLKPYF
ncbi:MAG: helix-hairpin-helix domain-containing protein [Prolixibacteraceae bacterium]|nr:helix-hairpin-helix domain-containing protein [Prolixibacteraceae bacterium]